MLQLTPQTRILLATEPVDFRKGIDGLALCVAACSCSSRSVHVFVFRIAPHCTQSAIHAASVLQRLSQPLHICPKHTPALTRRTQLYPLLCIRSSFMQH